MFTIYFTNFGYASERTFRTFNEALAYARSKCFECSILLDGQLEATWSPLRGLSRCYN